MSEMAEDSGRCYGAALPHLRAARAAYLAAILQQKAAAVVDLVEGLDGYGTCLSAMNGKRLKDQPAWVEFYNAVSETRRDSPALSTPQPV